MPEDRIPFHNSNSTSKNNQGMLRYVSTFLDAPINSQNRAKRSELDIRNDLLEKEAKAKSSLIFLYQP